MKTRFSSVLVALLVATTPAVQAAEATSSGQSLYLIGAVGGTRYGFDCWGTPFNCNGGHATGKKAVLGWRTGPWGAELVVADYGRASTASSIASRPGETIRLQGTGLSLTATGQVANQWQAVARLGAMRVRHERSGELPMRTWSPSIGLGLLWQAMPALGLELAWDMTSGEGSDSGTGVANAYTLGLRLSF